MCMLMLRNSSSAHELRLFFRCMSLPFGLSTCCPVRASTQYYFVRLRRSITLFVFDKRAQHGQIGRACDSQGTSERFASLCSFEALDRGVHMRPTALG